ncbi:MAG: alpha/beta hydrolase [Sphingorhabdus sp.]|nr:alpha/beta fold hydrolase [Novosphingobium sp.]
MKFAGDIVLSIILGLFLANCAPHKNDLKSHACPAALLQTKRQLECATLTVPEDWSRPTARSIAIELVVVRAARRVPALPPVIYLHGGPGGGVVQNLSALLEEPIGRGLLGQDQDWFFFDQRGTGASRPLLDCPGVVLNDAGPASPGDVQQLRSCAGVLRNQGHDLGQYQSRSIARDVQAIRQALGISIFDLYGLSYGSRVAAAILLHQPQGLRAIIYDSPWPPEAKWTEPGPGWVSREVRQVLHLCDQQPDCAAANAGLGARLDSVIGKWLNERSRSGQESAQRLSLYLMAALYDPKEMRRLPSKLHQIVGGNLNALPTSKDLASDYTVAQHMAVLCNEELPFERKEAVVANAGDDPIAVSVARTMVGYFGACDAFATAQPPSSEQMPIHSNVPVLFLAAGIDAGCPAELSQVAVKGYTRGQIAVLPYATHQLARGNPCARDMARQFLRDPFHPVSRACLSGESVPPDFAPAK